MIVGNQNQLTLELEKYLDTKHSKLSPELRTRAYDWLHYNYVRPCLKGSTSDKLAAVRRLHNPDQTTPDHTLLVQPEVRDLLKSFVQNSNYTSHIQMLTWRVFFTGKSRVYDGQKVMDAYSNGTPVLVVSFNLPSNCVPAIKHLDAHHAHRASWTNLSPSWVEDDIRHQAHKDFAALTKHGMNLGRKYGLDFYLLDTQDALDTWGQQLQNCLKDPIHYQGKNAPVFVKGPRQEPRWEAVVGFKSTGHLYHDTNVSGVMAINIDGEGFSVDSVAFKDRLSTSSTQRTAVEESCKVFLLTKVSLFNDLYRIKKAATRAAAEAVAAEAFPWSEPNRFAWSVRVDALTTQAEVRAARSINLAARGIPAQRLDDVAANVEGCHIDAVPPAQIDLGRDDIGLVPVDSWVRHSGQVDSWLHRSGSVQRHNSTIISTPSLMEEVRDARLRDLVRTIPHERSITYQEYIDGVSRSRSSVMDAPRFKPRYADMHRPGWWNDHGRQSYMNKARRNNSMQSSLPALAPQAFSHITNLNLFPNITVNEFRRDTEGLVEAAKSITMDGEATALIPAASRNYERTHDNMLYPHQVATLEEVRKYQELADDTLADEVMLTTPRRAGKTTAFRLSMSTEPGFAYVVPVRGPTQPDLLLDPIKRGLA